MEENEKIALSRRSLVGGGGDDRQREAVASVFAASASLAATNPRAALVCQHGNNTTAFAATAGATSTKKHIKLAVGETTAQLLPLFCRCFREVLPPKLGGKETPARVLSGGGKYSGDARLQRPLLYR